MAKIALNFEDGLTRIIDVKQGETIADAAFEARINIPLDCNDGVCGTCKCRVRSGQFDMGDEYIEDAITDEEIAEGYGLACQMRPESDMVVDILASSAACKVKTEKFATTITALEFVSSEIVKLVVKTQNGSKISFLPGQYANIEIPNLGITRSFSFSGKSDSDTLEFLVRLLPQGAMSDYLRNDAQVGATLYMTAPFGSFYLRDLAKPALFFAGGTGIAPFLAMLERLYTEGGVKNPIQLFYGATTDENLVELDRLKAFSEKLPFTYFPCVSIEKSTVHAQGFVTQWVNKKHLGSHSYDVYVCGPPPMVDAVNGAIAKEQIVQNQYFTEKFVPSGN